MFCNHVLPKGDFIYSCWNGIVRVLEWNSESENPQQVRVMAADLTRAMHSLSQRKNFAFLTKLRTRKTVRIQGMGLKIVD